MTTVHDRSVGQRIAAGWSDTLYRLKNSCVDFFVWFVVNLPYLLIWAAFAGMIIWICLRQIKKHRKTTVLQKQEHAGESTSTEQTRGKLTSLFFLLLFYLKKRSFVPTYFLSFHPVFIVEAR